MPRSLASVQRVLQLLPVEGADKIELAQIGGWQCVVKKGEFQPGALAVYLEIDAIPPDTEPFRFLWSKKAKPGEVMPAPEPQPKNFRIRTIRLRGALSQGLLLPAETLGLDQQTLQEGDDLTERLGVVKWEPPPIVGMGDPIGEFPTGVPKTDEMRVQSVPKVLEELQGLPWVATVKYDGTSATYLLDPNTETLVACSRNLSIAPGPNTFWTVAREHGIEEKLKLVGPNYVLQGEVCGPGIQKNYLGLRTLGFFIFSVWHRNEHRYLNDSDMRALCDKIGLTTAEVAARGDAFALSLEDVLTLAEGPYTGTSNEREGIVIRPLEERYSPTLNSRLSFKAISNKFLLGGGE